MILVISVNSRIQNWNEIGNSKSLLSGRPTHISPTLLILLCSKQSDGIELPNLMGERRGLNPRVMDPQSIALIHLATSAPSVFLFGPPERDLSVKQAR